MWNHDGGDSDGSGVWLLVFQSACCGMFYVES